MLSVHFLGFNVRISVLDVKPTTQLSFRRTDCRSIAAPLLIGLPVLFRLQTINIFQNRSYSARGGL